MKLTRAGVNQVQTSNVEIGDKIWRSEVGEATKEVRYWQSNVGKEHETDKPGV